MIPSFDISPDLLAQLDDFFELVSAQFEKDDNFSRRTRIPSSLEEFRDDFNNFLTRQRSKPFGISRCQAPTERVVEVFHRESSTSSASPHQNMSNLYFPVTGTDNIFEPTPSYPCFEMPIRPQTHDDPLFYSYGNECHGYQADPMIPSMPDPGVGSKGLFSLQRLPVESNDLSFVPDNWMRHSDSRPFEVDLPVEPKNRMPGGKQYSPEVVWLFVTRYYEFACDIADMINSGVFSFSNSNGRQSPRTDETPAPESNPRTTFPPLLRMSPDTWSCSTLSPPPVSPKYSPDSPSRSSSGAIDASGSYADPTMGTTKRKAREYYPRLAKKAKVSTEPVKRQPRRNRHSTAPKRNPSARSNGKKMYPCTKGCNWVCGSHGDLSRHYQSLIHQEASFVCPTCEAKLTRTDSLKRHFLSQGCQEKKAELEAEKEAAARAKGEKAEVDSESSR